MGGIAYDKWEYWPKFWNISLEGELLHEGSQCDFSDT